MRNQTRKVVWAIGVLIISVTLIVGCRSSNSAGSNARPTPGSSFTEADIAKLRWIEGTWRGTGEGTEQFFERYRFERPTTIVVDSFSDETLSTVTDSSRFELKNGEFGHTEGNARSAASEISSDAVQFVPVTGAKNSFRFQKEPNGTWKAILDTPASEGKPTKQVIYKMERWPANK